VAALALEIGASGVVPLAAGASEGALARTAFDAVEPLDVDVDEARPDACSS
jgi:hypothetical protein